MQSKELEITFSPDGNVTVDQIGWKGKECDKTIDDLLRVLGTEKAVTKKPEYSIPQKIQIRE